MPPPSASASQAPPPKQPQSDPREQAPALSQGAVAAIIAAELADPSSTTQIKLNQAGT